MKDSTGVNTGRLTSHVALFWSTAEILRGDYKEHEYCNVVLPFIVLTRLDTIRAGTKRAVLAIKATAAPSTIKERQYAKAACTRLGIHQTAGSRLCWTIWTVLVEFDRLRASVRAAAREVIEAYSFYNVIERLDKASLLHHVLNKFTCSKANRHPVVASNSQMGQIVEELIRQFSDLSNETAGKHLTPREVISLMVNLLFKPEEDINRLCADVAMASFYDPGDRTGGILSITAQHVENLNNTARLEVYGQELNPQTFTVVKPVIMVKG